MGSQRIQEAEDKAEKEERYKKLGGDVNAEEDDGWEKASSREQAGSLTDAVGFKARSGSFREAYSALT